MARKIKIPNHVKKHLARNDIKREERARAIRKQYLIICEGEKTEPNYFRALRDSLPKGVLNVCHFHIDGTGYNTKSLVNKSMAFKTDWEKNSRRPVDKLWIVFDRDSFKPQSFNAAIQNVFGAKSGSQCGME